MDDAHFGHAMRNVSPDPVRARPLKGAAWPQQRETSTGRALPPRTRGPMPKAWPFGRLAPKLNILTPHLKWTIKRWLAEHGQVAITALIILVALIAINTKKPDVVTSPDVLSEIYGCYYFHDSMALRINPDGSAAGNGWRMRYQILSFKGALKFFPERGLWMHAEPNGNVSIIESGGTALYHSIERGRDTQILFFSDAFQMYLITRRQCT